jgi:hypothetical protein
MNCEKGSFHQGMGGVRGGIRGEFFSIIVCGKLHPIIGVGDGSIPLDMEVGEYSSEGRIAVFTRKELHPIRGVGDGSIPSDMEVGEYPSGGTEDCFHHEGVGRREYFKGSREEFTIRFGERMIRGEEEYSSEGGRRKIFSGGGEGGRREVSQMGRKKGI